MTNLAGRYRPGFVISRVPFPITDAARSAASPLVAIQDHDNPVTQHGLASYVTKFKSQSFRLRSKFGVAFAQQESWWRSLSFCQRKACSGSKPLDLLVQTLLFYACCFTEKTGYYKSKLASFTEHPGCHRLSLCMSFACHTAVKLGPCCQPCFTVTDLLLFTGATHALQALSAPAKPYTERCAG